MQSFRYRAESGCSERERWQATMEGSSLLSTLTDSLEGFLDVRVLQDQTAEQEAPEVTFQVTTHPDQVWFRGHFKGLALLPGVVQLKSLVLCPARATFGDLGRLKALRRVKFTRPLVPGDRLSVHLKLVRASGVLSFDIRFESGETSDHPLIRALPQTPSLAARGAFHFDNSAALARRSFLAVPVALLTLAAFSRPVRADTELPAHVRKLLHAHRQATFIEARFVEEKHIEFLKVPLESEGMLYFAEPDLLARVTTAPGTSKLVVRNEHIAFREGNGPVTRLALDDRPELRALVEGVSLLFAGNEAAIARNFGVTYKGNKAAWTLDLVPVAERMRKLVTKIVVRGQETRLFGFAVHEASGDVSDTKLSQLNLGRKLSPEEKTKIFSV